MKGEDCSPKIVGEGDDRKAVCKEVSKALPSPLRDISRLTRTLLKYRGNMKTANVPFLFDGS
jgi:hypothetical protein